MKQKLTLLALFASLAFSLPAHAGPPQRTRLGELPDNWSELSSEQKDAFRAQANNYDKESLMRLYGEPDANVIVLSHWALVVASDKYWPGINPNVQAQYVALTGLRDHPESDYFEAKVIDSTGEGRAFIQRPASREELSQMWAAPELKPILDDLRHDSQREMHEALEAAKAKIRQLQEGAGK